jgi:hypothetical protein
MVHSQGQTIGNGRNDRLDRRPSPGTGHGVATASELEICALFLTGAAARAEHRQISSKLTQAV